jgi:sterol O-acyltransferase
MSVVETISALIIPILFCHIMIFYMMFELILNGIAEVLCFADRRFYDDWWNSTTWDEVS